MVWLMGEQGRRRVEWRLALARNRQRGENTVASSEMNTAVFEIVGQRDADIICPAFNRNEWNERLYPPLLNRTVFNQDIISPPIKSE